MSKPTLEASGADYANACAGRISVYIDSFNLYHGLKDADTHARSNGGAGWKHLYWYDPALLARALVPSGCSIADVRFFTAHALGAQKGDDPTMGASRDCRRRRQTAVLDAIKASGTTPITGVYSPRPRNCRACGSKWTTFEEKMTDARIAVQIVIDAMHDRFDTCVVVSADADIVPPLEMLRSEFPQKRRVVIAPPHRNAKRHLPQIAECFKLTRSMLEGCMMPNPVLSATGYPISCPKEWARTSYPSPTSKRRGIWAWILGKLG